ncbi:MAG: ester cyclase [Actinomycetota bacterium]|nr:ester cyclase [Actinomycetota bacterium]
MSYEDTASIARTLYEAFNDRDFDRGAALVGDNAVWINVPTGETFTGPDGFRRDLEQWDRAFPDAKLTDIKVRGGDGFAVIEFTGRGTNTGPLASPAGELPATNRSVEVKFCDVLEISAGKITGGRSYWDMATMMTQLGLMPEVPAGATA